MALTASAVNELDLILGELSALGEQIDRQLSVNVMNSCGNESRNSNISGNSNKGCNESVDNGIDNHVINVDNSSDSSDSATDNCSGNDWYRLSRQDSVRSWTTSSTSSGYTSERGSNTSTPTMEQMAFEADFPSATIKRKPNALQPKIPLTMTTRNIALQSEDALVEVHCNTGEEEIMGLRVNQQICGTLKRNTLRRSTTDDRICDSEQQIETNDRPNVVNRELAHSLVDDLPLPPPPQVLTRSLSALSLDSLPPPPEEVLLNQTIANATPIVSPNGSLKVSPKVPPKPKLVRRASECGADRNSKYAMLRVPEVFVRELQRVMDNNWKAAQTLNCETQSNHQTSCVLGFREPTYGNICVQNKSQHMPHMRQQHIYDVVHTNAKRVRNHDISVVNSKHKRVPPPPPKRSENTRLSQTRKA